MLSAVAARKARLKSTPANSAPVTPAPSPAPTAAAPRGETGGTISESRTTPAKPSSGKRKASSSNTPKSTVKKARHSKSKETTRYFLERKVLESDSESDASIIVDGEDSEPGITGSADALSRPPVAPPRRAYSPSRPVEDSSDEEVVPPPSTELHSSGSPSSVPLTLTSFEPLFNENVFELTLQECKSCGLPGEPAVALVLSPSDTLSFIGTARICVLRGSVSLFGTTLHASSASCTVFAPKSSPVPVLEVSGDQGESSRDAFRQLPERLLGSLKMEGAVIVLQELWTGVEGLGRIVRTFDGFFTPSTDDGLEDLFISGVHVVRTSSRDVQPFQLPSSWKLALDEVDATAPVLASSPPAFFVKGPKNSGKSSFSRTLANRLLSRYRRVAYLDCDLGQSEFTPGGMVALTVLEEPIFGPPFTHPTIPYQAHYIGSSSPRTSPSHYLDSIEALLYVYRLDIQLNTVFDMDADMDAPSTSVHRIANAIPLVVNTMGWSKGLGADLTRKIEQLVTPTSVFALEFPHIPHGSTTLDSDGSPAHVLHAVPPPEHALRQTAADHRALALMSYFHAIFPRDARPGFTVQRWDTRLPLCFVPPYEIEVPAAVSRVIYTGVGAEDVVPDEAALVLNGALVALVRTDDDVGPTGADGLDDDSPCPLPYEQGAPPPDPTLSACLSLALVRAVSPTSRRIHLLTPRPVSAAHTLVKGELEIPIWGMLDHTTSSLDILPGAEHGNAPYLRWGSARADGVVGGEKRRVRRNLMRKGQM
ncbi:hypothetical protein K488DRAFT_51871 [Vararia minispora EC-137]|uniref:Uncharacterized protein n=1 Tax=Vararia minispora EC-137 TaxID=1314806 RepID=A0ACB8QIU7_9AGAM|nr:hypothetical protein K488DRAFT_51871 [Vararia minispora EC-137]